MQSESGVGPAGPTPQARDRQTLIAARRRGRGASGPQRGRSLPARNRRERRPAFVATNAGAGLAGRMRYIDHPGARIGDGMLLALLICATLAVCVPLPFSASATEHRSISVKREFQLTRPCPSTGLTSGAYPRNALAPMGHALPRAGLRSRRGYSPSLHTALSG
jgi:hypothetical protein